VYIINRENVKWLVEHYGKNWPFDMVVIDESSSFKSPSSQRFKALRKVFNLTDRMVQLTGTPSPNGMMDLWAQIALLDNGERLGRNMTAYKNRYFESDFMGYNYTLRDGADKLIQDKIADITISMKSEDYLQLPERIDLVERVQMSPKHQKQYKQLEKEFILALNDGEVTALSAATLANKLLQYANGALYVDDIQTYEVLHQHKLDALAELVEDNPTENILVAYNYKFDLDQLVKRFPDAVVMDKEGVAVDEWNKGNIKMLLAHPASAGHGLNLQHGGAVTVWYGLNWSLELYQQFNGRLHRQGQKRCVRVIHLVAEGTIDEKVMQAIENKAETQEALMQALKV